MMFRTSTFRKLSTSTCRTTTSSGYTTLTKATIQVCYLLTARCDSRKLFGRIRRMDGQVPATNKTVMLGIAAQKATDHLTDLHDDVVDGVALTTRYNSKGQNRVQGNGIHRQEGDKGQNRVQGINRREEVAEEKSEEEQEEWLGS